VLKARAAYAGLDLSGTTDLTAFVIIWPPGADDADPVTYAKAWFWLPEEGLTERAETDRVPYMVWKAQEALQATPGRTVNRKYVAQQIGALMAFYAVGKLACDRWKFQDLLAWFAELEVSLPEVMPVGTGFKGASPAVDCLERALLDTQLRIAPNPCLTWCASNTAVLIDPAGNRKFDKRRATARIDGIVALAIALYAAQPQPREAEAEPEYQLFTL
jgi:phage terminase large subunit-like protein